MRILLQVFLMLSAMSSVLGEKKSRFRCRGDDGRSDGANKCCYGKMDWIGLEFLGNYCQRGDGDCNTDSHCADGLICGTNNCKEMNKDGKYPERVWSNGAMVDPKGWFDDTDDCCCKKGEDPGCDGDDGCFSLDSQVRLSSGLTIPMSGLRKGDLVATVNGEREVAFTEFLGWADLDTTTATSFLQLTTENRSSSVVLTGHHFLMSTPGLDEDPQMKRADEVAEGDFLLTSSGLEKVSSIGRVTRQGRGSPLTMTGDLLVNGVLSSNYAHAPSHSIAHLWMTPFRWFDLLSDEETDKEDFVRRYSKLGSRIGDLLLNTYDGLAPGKVHSIMKNEISFGTLL